MYIQRLLQKNIEKWLFKGKIIVIYGPRRVGKTTLVQHILESHSEKKTLFLNGDDPDVRLALTDKPGTELKRYLGSAELIIIDEAQRVTNIGLTLKLIVDTMPERQVIATGSSSFDISNRISEPLTGRIYPFFLSAFSLLELKSIHSSLDLERLFEGFLRFGLYPETIQQNEEEAKKLIALITDQYLYKDLLEFENLRHPEILQKLLRALALQLGNEVSYTELAQLIQVSKQTVERYLDLLEKSFVIFRLVPLSRNPRKEIGISRKIYFYDLGIRNSLINNFNRLELRNDIGALFENFCIVERMKRQDIEETSVNRYFWRTYQQQEIDLIEEAGGKLQGFEFKWKKTSAKIPKNFLSWYPGSRVDIITKENLLPDFLGLAP